MTITIPEWQRDAVELDAETIGAGSRSQGGFQAVMTFALGMYLSLDEEERRMFAQFSLPATAPQHVLEKKFRGMWPIDFLIRLSVLPEGRRLLVEKLMAFVEKEGVCLLGDKHGFSWPMDLLYAASELTPEDRQDIIDLAEVRKEQARKKSPAKGDAKTRKTG